MNMEENVEELRESNKVKKRGKSKLKRLKGSWESGWNVASGSTFIGEFLVNIVLAVLVGKSVYFICFNHLVELACLML